MLNPLDGVYGSLIKFGLIVALVGGLYGVHVYKVHEAVKDAVQVVQIQHNTETFKQKEILLDKQRVQDLHLQEDFNKRKGEQDAKIKALNSDVSNLLISLRSRPDRPTSTSGNSPSSSSAEGSTGVTGQGLYKSDAEFLARSASDTETLKLGLIQCYKDYDVVKQSIESFNQK
jgi:hypothetical protein